MKLKNFFLVILILCVVLLWWWRFIHFVVQDVPLGYDPGIYRSYFLAFVELFPNITYDSLEPWMKEAFPPAVWMITWLIHNFIWVHLDRFLTRWVWRQSVLLSLGMYVMCRPFWKSVAVIASLLSRISFVQYQLFWWNYIKQLWWAFFVLIALWLLVRRKYVLMIPLVSMLFLIHRPAGLVMWGVIWVYILWLIIIQFKKWEPLWKKSMSIASIVLISWIIAFPLYWELFDVQILPLLSRFLLTLDVPNYVSWSNDWWTFLTLYDLFVTNGFVVLLSLYWWVVMRRKKWWTVLHAWLIFCSLWVFLQMDFYRRMIWYADLFFISCASYWIHTLWKLWWNFSLSWKIIKILLIIVWCIHGLLFSYRVERTWRPIMQADEFAFFQSLPDLLPEDAVVMSTFSTYSWWLKWRSERPTLAPWLFNDDKWNKQQRIKNRWESNWIVKCKSLKETYWELWINLYIWQGSKQPPINIEWASCLKTFIEAPTKRRILYHVSL